ncbi:MAG: 23S rRNA (uracil(1939)-C(5))-methyltransferase RlmD [Steroidobacteraceae bacterium]|nr:23S rRNA (uracil(1939)-C(5))-methyltransferase RlmD [Steroidobacteraceae bacterium]
MSRRQREASGGERREVDVVALSHDGRGIARIDGKAVFIAGALPGERVIIEVVKRRRRMDEAGLLEVLVASKDRVVPRCAHFGLCGGCSLQHLSSDAQVEAKQAQMLEDLARIGGVSPARVLAPLRGPAWGYRRRARLGVRYVHKKGRVLAGFRERDKPYLADLARCEVLIGEFATLPADLATLVDALSIRERVPQVEFASGDTASALVFRVMQEPNGEDLARLEDFGRRRKLGIYLQSAGPDSIRPLGDTPPALNYAIGAYEVRIGFGPADFVQVNSGLNEAMVVAALAALDPDPGDTVLDLFCGLGNFTLPLARRSAQVVGIEGDAGLVGKARMNAVENGIENAAFHVENLFEPASFGPWAGGRYERVLLDPPRAGARELIEHILHWRPRRVVYISCHPGSLARDAGILVATKEYELAAAGVMDMFAHTTHVESMAVFERRR